MTMPSLFTEQKVRARLAELAGWRSSPRRSKRPSHPCFVRYRSHKVLSHVLRSHCACRLARLDLTSRLVQPVCPGSSWCQPTPLKAKAEGPGGSLSYGYLSLIAVFRRATHTKRAARTHEEGQMMLARAAFTCQSRRCASSWTPFTSKSIKRDRRVVPRWMPQSPFTMRLALSGNKWWVLGRCRQSA